MSVYADAQRPETPWDVSDISFYTEDTWRAPFAELRQSMPVSYRSESPYGGYWSVVTHDLIQQVEINPDLYSSSFELGNITIADSAGGAEFPNFIAMDAPRHTEQRKVVQPAFNPSQMAQREIEVRQRTKDLFDALPVGETFDWVETVSIPLTIGMLCILFDFPWEERHDLKRWSDLASNVSPEAMTDEYHQTFLVEMNQMLMRFDALLESKRALPPSDDLMSRMIHSEAMGNLTPIERIANIALLIVGGNDTTRNSMSGLVEALNLYPDQLAALQSDPSLIPNAAQEIIRWQTPVTHMRRTCTVDTELGGQQMAKGDKVVMWYISANRDETIFPDAERFDVKRDNARRHIGFGHGVHRCVGARLAEIQLATLIGEMIERKLEIEMVAPPTRLASPFLHGFTHAGADQKALN
jgi:cytochrome P450